MNTPSRFGISAAVATPFFEDGGIDFDRLAAHSHRLLEEGCASLTYFGTTGEGPSLSLEERGQTIDAMTAAGVPGDRINVGIIVSSLGDALSEARKGIEIGCNALLVAPPHYFKDSSDDGLFAWYAGLIGELGSVCPRIILYNIPQVTAVPLSIGLVRRLKAAFPDTIYGVKDSSGDWENGKRLLEIEELAVMLGDERLLAEASKLGGQGMISGVANFDAQSLVRTLETGIPDPALNALVDTLVSHPVIPAVKLALSARLGDEAWSRVRAPLRTLDSAAADNVLATWNSLQLRKVS